MEPIKELSTITFASSNKEPLQILNINISVVNEVPEGATQVELGHSDIFSVPQAVQQEQKITKKSLM